MSSTDYIQCLLILFHSFFVCYVNYSCNSWLQKKHIQLHSNIWIIICLFFLFLFFFFSCYMDFISYLNSFLTVCYKAKVEPQPWLLLFGTKSWVSFFEAYIHACYKRLHADKLWCNYKIWSRWGWLAKIKPKK
jgi:predicted PurR-regulated permease PerM